MMNVRTASMWASLYFWAALVVMLLAMTLTLADEMVACQAEPRISAETWWSWYTIDGRRCWYQGRPRSRSRGQLFWPLPPDDPHDQVPQAPPLRWDLEHRWWG